MLQRVTHFRSPRAPVKPTARWNQSSQFNRHTQELTAFDNPSALKAKCWSPSNYNKRGQGWFLLTLMTLGDIPAR